MRKSVVVVLTVFIVSLAINACGNKNCDEPTKCQSQAGLEKLTREASQGSGHAGSNFADSVIKAANNPKFASAKNITPNVPNGSDIDGLYRPVLEKMFGGAKLTFSGGEEKPKRDGEVVENRLKYVVKRTIVDTDGDALHSALRAAGFSTSPRLGSKPTHFRAKRQVMMSLFESTSKRSYSFVVIVDAANQTIEVESYRLGSKYDRLM